MNIVPLSSLFLSSTPLSKQTHNCKWETSVFERRYVTFENLNFSSNHVCHHLCNLLFSGSVNVALRVCASKRG